MEGAARHLLDENDVSLSRIREEMIFEARASPKHGTANFLPSRRGTLLHMHKKRPALSRSSNISWRLPSQVRNMQDSVLKAA